MNLSKNIIINTFNWFSSITIFTFLIFILLVRLEKINAVFGYIFVYIFFPIIIIYFVSLILFLIKRKDVKSVKNLSISFGKQLIILLLVYAIIYFTK